MRFRRGVGGRHRTGRNAWRLRSGVGHHPPVRGRGSFACSRSGSGGQDRHRGCTSGRMRLCSPASRSGRAPASSTVPWCRRRGAAPTLPAIPRGAGAMSSPEAGSRGSGRRPAIAACARRFARLRWHGQRLAWDTVHALVAPPAHAFGAFGENSVIVPPARIENPDCIHVGRDVVILEHVWLAVERRAGQPAPVLRIGDETRMNRFVKIECLGAVTSAAACSWPIRSTSATSTCSRRPASTQWARGRQPSRNRS